jgi:hypothetical protein
LADEGVTVTALAANLSDAAEAKRAVNGPKCRAG